MQKLQFFKFFFDSTFISKNNVPKSFWFVFSFLIFISLAMMFSIGGGGFKLFFNQLIRFSIGILFLLIFSSFSLNFFLKRSFQIYFFSLLLLLGTNIFGAVGMGARRWINLYFFQLQTSDIMRIGMILGIAKYLNGIKYENLYNLKNIIIPSLMILIPVFITLKQPDLGSGAVILLTGAGMLFFFGVPIRFFVTSFSILIVSMPLMWSFLHEYQQKRILTFLNPELDPLGAGYHIMQSKIALGSSGFWGKGFMRGTQSHLNFLPEKHTDFIFTTISEEFGFLSVIFLILIYSILIFINIKLIYESKNLYGKLVASGVTFSIFLYVFLNIGMTSGILPIVGIPLPFISYGGSSIVTLLISEGIVFSLANSRKQEFF